MRKEEAVYWKSFILKTIEERLPKIEVSDLIGYEISEFEKHHMQTITGQQMLPQNVFRDFLQTFEKIPAIQEEIIRAQERISVWLERLPEESTIREVEGIFDGTMWETEYMWCPSMDIDSEGYAALNIEVDNEGYAHFTDDPIEDEEEI